jgi:hypothetical protein
MSAFTVATNVPVNCSPSRRIFANPASEKVTT